MSGLRFSPERSLASKGCPKHGSLAWNAARKASTTCKPSPMRPSSSGKRGQRAARERGSTRKPSSYLVTKLLPSRRVAAPRSQTRFGHLGRLPPSLLGTTPSEPNLPLARRRFDRVPRCAHAIAVAFEGLDLVEAVAVDHDELTELVVVMLAFGLFFWASDTSSVVPSNFAFQLRRGRRLFPGGCSTQDE